LVGAKTFGATMDVAFSPEKQQMTALNNFNEKIREYYQQAVACSRQADAQNDQKVKQQFWELTRLWLLLAERCDFNKA
jgi:hypothetical protein